jgi:hypothetical protein
MPSGLSNYVIASEARQSSSTLGILDCRVAALLAMTILFKVIKF